LNCGRERHYVFEKVYYHQGSQDAGKTEEYDPLIIPEQVVCSKCGAIDRYRPTGMARMAVLASMLAGVAGLAGSMLRDDQRISFVQFQALGREMHPLEAIQEYERLLQRYPDDADLRIGYGNVLRFLGRRDDAQLAYRQVLDLEPDNLEAYVNLATLAQESDELAAAIPHWRAVLRLIPGSDLDVDARFEIERSARESLRALERGEAPPALPSTLTEIEKPAFVDRSHPKAQPELDYRRLSTASTSHGTSASARFATVGRNEPCPCGSGRKFKHCHGKKTRR
jgi:tetratricopeptide (TPR) repeat protein